MKTLLTTRLFNDLWHDFDSAYTKSLPEHEQYETKLNLAGIKKENIKVKAEDGLLHISAEQDDKAYSRYLSIPSKADPPNTLIKYEDGLLHIKFIKNEKDEGVNIEVN